QLFNREDEEMDRFKDINDTCGHEAGDQLLVAISERLSKTLRESDTLARVGGDEFVFILPDTDTKEAQKVASRVAEALTPPFFTQGYQFKTSVSIGITQFPEDGADLNELLKNADIAMFQAKDGGQDYQIFHQEQQRSVQLRVHREGELRKAIQGQQLAVQFQPQVRLDERRVFGGEALVRWPHPDWGPVSPEEFIPLAEQTGLIHPLGQLVLDEALERLGTWLNRYDSALRVAVNLS
ncbi:MAG: diguanylate cyclase domain-containing protein, partial [Thiohalorhabdaceae bacterium]